MPAAALETKPDLRLPVARCGRREVARLVVAIERGQPVEKAIEVVGIDPVVGARRILQALESWSGWPRSR